MSDVYQQLVKTIPVPDVELKSISDLQYNYSLPSVHQAHLNAGEESQNVNVVGQHCPACGGLDISSLKVIN